MSLSFTEIQDRYDVVVVGARPAGAGTALLLARQGARVLLVDRGRYGSDTLSTHALMRGGVLQLLRWGVLPRIVAAGTPPVAQATFIYDGEALAVRVKPRDGVTALFAPRRTVLDRAIVDVAEESGVQVAYGTRVVDLQRRDDGRVTGAVLASQEDTLRVVQAPLVIGADGLRSQVARLVAAVTTRSGQWAAANVFGYWSGLPVDGYRWYYSPGLSVGAIPTNEGLTCVFASVPAPRFNEVFGHDVATGYRQVIDQVGPDLVDGMRHGQLEGSLHGFPGHVGIFRRSAGPGWALVGDAGYFKDPLTAHGITDALIEAEYLARAIQAGTDAAIADYEAGRDARTRELFDVTDRIASFTWTLDQARALHKQLAEAMSAEVKTLNALTLEETPA
jgi:2-polyprenyl-6-methoxyphenol hydroxylase-like FAD-dependent oxidoreductase